MYVYEDQATQDLFLMQQYSLFIQKYNLTAFKSHPRRYKLYYMPIFNKNKTFLCVSTTIKDTKLRYSYFKRR